MNLVRHEKAATFTECYTEKLQYERMQQEKCAHGNNAT